MNAPLTPEERGALIRRLAREVGFDAVGLAPAEPLDPAPFERFLSEGLAADMDWLRDERRLDPEKILEGARTVVVFLKSYFDPAQHPGWVARYARGADYHGLLIRRLRKVRKRLHAADPGVRTYGGVDFGLLPEKPWAQRAGLGWIGKNGCLVTRTHGSWVLLASLIVDREVAPYDTPHEDFCGSCSRCLGACPTDAFPRPYVVDARRCISYLTIENRGPVPDELKAETGAWLFGCDDCQEVCPWNLRFHRPTDEGRFAPRATGLYDVPLERLLTMDEATYGERSRGTALARPKYAGILRNALLAAGARGDRRLADACRAHLSHPHPAVRDAAAWAVERIG
ncbi:MAG TPA: tRNA epoxyqueuosine(34) reductase QueG [Fredinandcohnia sp.]|nr:tRNA epoxyqueuosine(34) reductase QueG [Fredinandcohnia sp.]